MGYDMHIRRVPPEGWEQWHDNFERNLPALLRAEKAEADATGEWERIHEVQDKIDLLCEEAKRTQKLSISSLGPAAVNGTPGVRIATDSDFVRTGDKLGIKVGPDSVPVADKEGRYHGGILFRRGSATFSGRAWESGHPVALTACRLATLVKARILGDEGEEYPLEPGARQVKT